MYFGLTNPYYLFDSHNRDATGLPAHNGASLMLTFRNVTGVQQYLIRLATALDLSGGMFEMLPISIKLNKSAHHHQTPQNVLHGRPKHTSVMSTTNTTVPQLQFHETKDKLPVIWLKKVLQKGNVVTDHKGY